MNVVKAQQNAPGGSFSGPSDATTAGAAAPAGAFSCVSAAWQAHESELLGYLRHQLADADTADDVLQDVFVKAMRQGEGFCRLDNPRAWLFQVARNALIDRARVNRLQVPLDEVGQEIEAPAPEALAPVDALASCLERTMAELPAEDADILRACDLEGMTQRAFAEARGLTLPATKSRLLRARQRLRDRLTTVCRVSFDPESGLVCGHDGRADDAQAPS